MSYNMQEFPKYFNTAGKITVITSLISVMVFAVVFLLNVGAKEFQQVEAQSGQATTTITVLNTPPAWTVIAQEQFGSSTTTPTNSGDDMVWVATGTDSNAAPYWLLICSGPNAAIPNAAAGPGSLGTAPPNCTATSTQWAVSASTTSGVQAVAATTTLESFAESNVWYGYICDDDPVNPRCNVTSYQGTGTTSSPFNVNHRPSLSAFGNNGPVDPGATLTFFATSTDTDTVDTADTMQLHICSTNSFEAASSSCSGLTLATSSFAAGTPVQLSAAYDIDIPFQDADYPAFAFVIDEHDHVASASFGSATEFTVNNVAPYVLGGDIDLNNGSTITLTQFAAETTGFPLQFTANDNNSCQNASAGDEIVDWDISIFRTNIGTTSCDEIGEYDANSCYTNTVATTTWNISCTASSTSCTYGADGIDTGLIVDCTFPLWYIADPTLGAATDTPYFATNWSAAVAPVDDNAATGALSTTTNPRELAGLLGIALAEAAIPYGALEPGDETGPTLANASTTILAIGNVAVDQLLTGQAMCGTYTSAVTCPNSASSTIPETFQVFSTSSASTYALASSTGNRLSSSTNVELEINVPKSTSTSVQASGKTYWGIRVPAAITLAGDYTGENTFFGKVAEVADWF